MWVRVFPSEDACKYVLRVQSTLRFLWVASILWHSLKLWHSTFNPPAPHYSAALHFVTFDPWQCEPLKSAIFNRSYQQGVLYLYVHELLCSSWRNTWDLKSVSRKGANDQCRSASLHKLLKDSILCHYIMTFYPNSYLLTYHMSCGDHFNLNSCITS